MSKPFTFQQLEGAVRRKASSHWICSDCRARIETRSDYYEVGSGRLHTDCYVRALIQAKEREDVTKDNPHRQAR